MNNKSHALLFLILLGGVILHQVMIYSGMAAGMEFLRWIETFFFLAGLSLLLRNGTFIKSLELKLTGLSIALMLIGALFKMMHWPGANILLIVGFGSMIGFYTKHFFRKQEKELLDYGKVVFVILFLLGMLFRIMHWPYGMEMQMLGLLIFLITALYFIRIKRLFRI